VTLCWFNRLPVVWDKFLHSGRNIWERLSSVQRPRKKSCVPYFLWERITLSNYSSGSFPTTVLDLTNGRGVDLVFDAVGATTFNESVKALAKRGMAISYGLASGLASNVEVLPLILKGARVAGASIFTYIEDPQMMQARAAEVIRGIQEGWFQAPGATEYAPNQSC